MSWKVNKFLFFVIFFSLFSLALAAGEEGQVIDLKSAIEIALERNPRLNQIRKDSEIAHWNQRIILSTYLPQAAAGFSAQRYDNHPSLTYDENYQFDLVLRQRLLDLSRIADIRAASSAKRYQKENQRAYEQVIIFDVIRYFYRSLLSRQELEIRKEALSLAEEEFQIAEARYSQGMVSYYDLLRSESKYLSAKSGLRRSQSEYHKSLNDFKNIIGYDSGEKIFLEGDFSFSAEQDYPESLTQTISSLHPRLAAAAYVVSQRQQNLSSSRAEFFPRLDLEAVQSASKYSQIPGGQEWDDYWRVNLKVSFPLFEGARRYFQVNKSHQELEQARIQEIEILNEIKKDIDSFYQDYLAAEEEMVSQKKNVERSRELYQLVRQRYKVGEASEIELLDAHLNLIDVESAFKEVRYRTIVSYYGVLLAAGQLEVERVASRE